jgi:hypothetical protein
MKNLRDFQIPKVNNLFNAFIASQDFAQGLDL